MTMVEKLDNTNPSSGSRRMNIYFDIKNPWRYFYMWLSSHMGIHHIIYFFLSFLILPDSRSCLNFLASGALFLPLIRGDFFCSFLFVFAYIYFLNVVLWPCISFVIIKEFDKNSYKRKSPVTLVRTVWVEWWEAEVGFQWLEKIIGIEEMGMRNVWLTVGSKGKERKSSILSE